jgi:hypothetical protein
MSENLFRLSDQNYTILRVFQIFGFLPLPLKRSDGILVKIPMAIYMVIILIIGYFEYGTVKLEENPKNSIWIWVYFTVWDAGFLMYSWIRVGFSMDSFREILERLAEIDRIIIDCLKMEAILKRWSSRTHQVLAILFALVCLLSLCHPIVSFQKTNEFPGSFLRYFLIIFTQMRVTQILYFYQKLYEKLSMIIVNLDELIKNRHIVRSQFEDAKNTAREMRLGITMVHERSSDKIENARINEKLLHFRNIYEKSWLIQEKLEQITSFNVLLYFFTRIQEVLLAQETLFADYWNNQDDLILLGKLN